MTMKRIIWITIALLVCFISATYADPGSSSPAPAEHVLTMGEVRS